MASTLFLVALLVAAAEPAAPATPKAAAQDVRGTEARPPAAHEARTPEAPEAKAPTPPAAPALPAGETNAKAAAEKDAKPADRAGESNSATRPVYNGNVPPSLTARALLDELRRVSKDRRSEQAQLGDERQKLDAMQRSIETSRAALREETKRLQEVIVAAAAAQAAREAADKKEAERKEAEKREAEKKDAERKDAEKRELERKRPGKASKDKQDSPIDILSKTVRGMKPDAAATMLSKLDRGLAAAILARMRPADAALVLDKMEPAASAGLVSLLAGRDRS